MAVIADLKDPLVGLDVHLEPFEDLLLQRRRDGRPRMASPAGWEREGSHPQLDSAPVAAGELPGEVLLVGSQAHADDSLSLADGGEDLATGLRGSLLEGALDLLSDPPQTGERVRPPLHHQPIGMPELGAQRGVALGDIAGERGDDAHGRFVS